MTWGRRFAQGLVFLALGGSFATASARADVDLVQTPPAVDPDEMLGRKLSPQEKETSAGTLAGEVDGAEAYVFGLVQGAKTKKDIILFNCLNQKLSDLRGLQKVAQDSKGGLAEAVLRENVDLQEFNYQKVFIAASQARTMRAEADACQGGSTLAMAGGVKVIVTVAGDKEGEAMFGASSGGSSRGPDATPVN